MICTAKYFKRITKRSDFTTKLYINRFDFKRVKIKEKNGKWHIAYDVTEE